MSDLISRSELIEDIKRRKYIDKPLEEIFETIIDEQPTVEPKRGEFTLAFTEEENVWKCSVCDKYWLLNNGTPFDNEMNFCPRCGADMREKVE